ncbi:MAG: hypothetical protein NC302_00530 [Bacteroidales bacterium]|nr:hypothetical protein [Bacteroidales bacterium]MCM1422262.1 hypothetical protein [bacterium]
MLEKKLTQDRQDRIDKIISQWEKDIEEQVESLPQPDGRTFDGPRTWTRVKLEKKYKPMIQAIKDE